MDNSRAIHHQILAVIPLGLNEFAMGLTYGWTAPTIKNFLDGSISEVTPTVEECSWIASLSEFGRALGPVFSILLLDTLGRKLMIQLGGATYFVIWLSILFSRSVLPLCVCRFVLGLSDGMCDTISSIYLGEICSPKIRGIFCSASAASFFLAALIEYILATYFSYNTTTLANLILALVCLLSTYLLIEPPQFLMLHERYEQAEKNLMWLKGSTSAINISAEFEDIKSNVASEKIKKTSYKQLLLAPANRRSLVVMFVSNILFAATGYLPICVYSTIIFPSTEFLTSYEFTICFGIIQLISAFASALVIERYNRRTLTLISFFIFTICNTVIAFLFYDDVNVPQAKYVPWILFFLVCICASFGAIMYSVLHIVRGEIFPQSIRPFGSGLCIMLLSCTGFVTLKTFLTVMDAYGIYVNFVIYAVVSFTALCYSYFKLPETRGKTLIEIQKSLEK